MTERVYQDAKSYASLKKEFIWQDHGLYKLKGISLPQRIYEVIEPQLGSPIPPAKGVKFPFYGVRPPIDPNRIFGRKAELDEIDQRLSSASSLAITGIRGIGKSTLVSMWVERVEQKGKFIDIVWLPIFKNTKLLDVICGFFEAIGEPKDYLRELLVQNQIFSLINKLREQPYLLILDGFEILISPNTNQPEEEGFTDLLYVFCQQIKDSRIVLTSWETPRGKYRIKPKTFVIQGLDEESAISFLRSLDVKGEEDDLKEVVKRSGGHPVALQQLA